MIYIYFIFSSDVLQSGTLLVHMAVSTPVCPKTEWAHNIIFSLSRSLSFALLGILGQT